MPNPVAHFSINADDTARARKFYEKVFGWTFEAWGPPDFFKIQSGGKDPGPMGALQLRRELGGKKVFGFECTVAVSDVDKVAKAAKANGGKVLMEKTTLSGIGDLIFVEDSEGNVVGAMRYDATAR